MGTVTKTPLGDVPATKLPNESWSRVLISSERVEGNASTLGVSVFKPGTVSTPLQHDVEELVYVSRGAGELRTEDGPVPFAAGDALHVPRATWHCVVNTGAEDVEMIFAFPTPQYPPTRRRETK